MFLYRFNDERLYPHFPKKGVLSKKYRCITIKAIAVKVYNVLFFNCIPSEIKKILMKN